MARGRGAESDDDRQQHIETLERLGRLVVSVARSPIQVCFVRLDAFTRHGRYAMRVA